MKHLSPSSISWVNVVLALVCVRVQAEADRSSPLQKVITLMTQLQGQVIREGEMAQTAYQKYSDWCEKTSKEKQFEISDGKDAKEDLEAVIDKAASDAEEAQARVEELSGSLATDAQDVKAMTLIREKEKGDFEAMDKELTSTISTLSRARMVLKKELAAAGVKSSAAFLQKPTQGMQTFAAVVGELVSTAQGVTAESRERLTELLQLQQGGQPVRSADAEESIPPSFLQESSDASTSGKATSGQPKKPVYKSHSGGVLETLEKMEEEARESQSKLRKKETKDKHSFELLKARLDDRIATQTKELEEQKKELAAAKETSATAKGKIDRTVKDLQEDQKFLKKLQGDCMERASEFQMEVQTRKDELTALASAKKTVQSIVFTQVSQEEEQPASFVQVGMETTSEVEQKMFALRIAGTAVAKKLKQLAIDEHSVALAQLSSRVTLTLKAIQARKGKVGDPFKKVKNLLKNMITKLEKTLAEEASQKKFCDREMKQTKASKSDHEGTIETLSTRIEEAVAEVAKAKQQRVILLGEIKDIESSQGEMDKLRQEEHSSFVKVTKELKQGLAGVQTALKVLRDFYSAGSDDEGGSFIQDMGSSMRSASASEAAAAAGGPSGGTAIIGLLEVCESDFSKNLAESQAEEDAAQDAYEKLTFENKKERAVKDKTVENIGQELARLEKKQSETTGDRSEVQQELDAVNEYLEKITKQCVAQPESYSDRKARRKREIEGLEQALAILTGEAEKA